MEIRPRVSISLTPLTPMITALQNFAQLSYRIQLALSSRLRNLLYRTLGVNFTAYATLRSISIPRNWPDITLGHVALDDGVTLLCSGPPKPNKIRIHDHVYINRYTIIDAHQSIEIHPHTLIGPHCFITDADHQYSPEGLTRLQPLTPSPVIIESNVWIGAHVSILKGVTIGKNSIIGAGAVVTQPIPPNSLAVGVPAKVIKSLPSI
ncbi:MAG: acyltransferase [Verrucomicrobiae bacterium]|nr:acyltransferase [Verrucomicrobiae bacterium]